MTMIEDNVDNLAIMDILHCEVTARGAIFPTVK